MMESWSWWAENTLPEQGFSDDIEKREQKRKKEFVKALEKQAN